MKSAGVLNKLKRTIKQTLLKRRMFLEEQSSKNTLVVYGNVLLNVCMNVTEISSRRSLKALLRCGLGTVHQPQVSVIHV